MRTSPQDEAFLKLNDTLTPDAVNNVVSTMGGFIADREARPAREADLPFPKVVIEIAYLKAMRDCTDPKYLELLSPGTFTPVPRRIRRVCWAARASTAQQFDRIIWLSVTHQCE